MLKEIEIWTSSTLGDTLAVGDTKAALPKLGRAKYEVSHVQLSVLLGNLSGLIEAFQAALKEPPKATSGYHVDEIELNLGVNANGGIALLGKLETGIEAGIKVKFKRERPRD
jgi:hypothetical protein